MLACDLDHFAIAAASLEEGTAFIRERLGVDIPRGGKHPVMNTHNCLMRLGPSSYLEVIAIDPDAGPAERPRWFALDDPAMQERLRRDGPQLVTWVLRTADIVAVAQADAVPLGDILPMTRGPLSWHLTVPEDGRLPGDGALPHLIEWDCGARPWEAMADLGCSLERLTLSHPNPAWLEQALAALCRHGFDFIEVKKADAPGLAARIKTPSGVVTI